MMHIEQTTRETSAAPPAGNRLQVRTPRIPPSRGLVFMANNRGRTIPEVDLRRWVRFNRVVLNTAKVDIACNGDLVEAFANLLDLGPELGVAISLRTDCESPPPDLSTLRDAGLHDLLLAPGQLGSMFTDWLHAASKADIPVRLWLVSPEEASRDSQAFARQMSERGVRAVHFALDDPFETSRAGTGGTRSRENLDSVQQIAEALETWDVEATILDVPFCALDQNHWRRIVNSRQFGLDHGCYSPMSYAFALKARRLPTFLLSQLIRMKFGTDTFERNPVDTWLLKWLLRHHYAWLASRFVRRLSSFRMSKGPDAPRTPSGGDLERELLQLKVRDSRKPADKCTLCALRRICDRDTPVFRTHFPGFRLTRQAGDLVVSPLHYGAEQGKYYDTIDLERSKRAGGWGDLPQAALTRIADRTPDIELGPSDYTVEHTYFDRMESGLKWWSLSRSEKLSSPLPGLEPPFTISVDFGAGIADYIGFAFGRYCRILCPMEAYRHNLILHVAESGEYVLLRDRQPVRPAEIEGRAYTPLRLGDRVQPRISMWNIDGAVATQNVRIWKSSSSESTSAPAIVYSVIIVSTRFTRRLQAVLRNLAHQQDFDLRTVEIIVCYVPGLDATDDLLDSLRLTYPNLRIVRMGFPEHNVHSKGFLINEAFRLSQGEWIMLLDSDTLLPPDYFAKIEAVRESADFIAPDGRRLLDKETTARILVGELDPWEEWDRLVEGTGEFRFRETQGIPVGFCQTFRRKYLEKFPYIEMEHFETADMHFGMQMKSHLGEEHRLSGTPVLHLDHGGSQWYGAQRHM